MGSSTITRYEVTRQGVSTWINVGLNTSYTYTGLTNGSSYTFRVRAYIGGSYTPEATVTATPEAAPADQSPQNNVAAGGGGTTAATVVTSTVYMPDDALPSGSSSSVVIDDNSVIDEDGTVTVNESGVFSLTSGTRFNVPYGTTVSPDGVVNLPYIGAAMAITHVSGLTFNVHRDAVVVLNEATSHGYTITCPNQFGDVYDTDWYYGDVNYACMHGLMVGTSSAPAAFSPNIATTRAMVVTILYRMSGSPDVSHLSNRFPDVAEDQWYYDAVKWAESNGIVYGNDNGMFNPDIAISRQDLAVILLRFADYTGISLYATRSYSGFNDSDQIADYAADAVERAYSAEIISGTPHNEFAPNSSATRAETSAMLHRFCEAAM